jgi:hypothetical protein
MRRRLLKSVASVMGAAALVVAPMALLAPSAQADGHVLTPDDEVAHIPGDAPEGTNHVEFWVKYLDEERDIAGATCVKENGPNEATFEIPAAPSGTMYVLAVTKAGAGDEANLVFFDPMAGDVVPGVDDKDISHYILCTVPKTTTPPPSTNPPVTGPPVETDRVADTGSAAGLGLALGATALVAGAGAMIVSRRRQGAHR